MKKPRERWLFGPECDAAEYSGNRAMIFMSHYEKGGILGWEFTLTTPFGGTRDFVTDYETAKRLWHFMVDVVDAWDKYGEEVD